MVMFKSSSFALLSALLVLGVSAASLSVEIDTDSEASKPKDAKFACVIKSTTCKSPHHYTDLEYNSSLNVTTCHADGFFNGYWHRAMPWSHGHGMFMDTFYVSTVPTAGSSSTTGAGAATKPAGYSTKGDDCIIKKPNSALTATDIRNILSDSINTHTSCNAYVQCYNVDDVTDQCFPKKDLVQEDGDDKSADDKSKDDKTIDDKSKDDKTIDENSLGDKVLKN